MIATIPERMTPDALIAELRLLGVDPTRPSAIRCPFHDDAHPSAGIYQRPDGVWAFKCHAVSCGVNEDFLGVRAKRVKRPVDRVVAEHVGERRGASWLSPPAARAALADAMTLTQAKAKVPGRVEAVYVYGPKDAPQMAVIRSVTPDGKTFRQLRREGNGWVFGAPPKPWPLYGLSRVAGADRVVVVEGEKCVHALADIGIVATTSPGGAANAEHADWSPLSGKRVVLWPDHDDAGAKYMRSVEAELQRLTDPPVVSIVRPDVLEMPPKGDVVDYLAMVDDPAAMHDAVDTVLDSSFSAGVAQDFEQYLEDIIAGRYKVEPWPFPLLTDATQALRPGCVTVICGEPEAGKSFLAMRCFMHWHDSGVPVDIYELEDDRNDHLLRAIAIREGNPKLSNLGWIASHPNEVRDAMARHREWIDSIGRGIWHSPKGLMTIDALAEWVEERAASGSRVIVIDPITVVDTQGQSVWEAHQRFIIAAKTTAVVHRCSVVLVTHPKVGQKPRGGITLDMIAGGAAFPRLSHCVLVLAKHSPDEQGRIRTAFGSLEQSFNRSLHVRKARHSYGGGMRIAYVFNSRFDYDELGLVMPKEAGP